jgi:hypothetical protein
VARSVMGIWPLYTVSGVAANRGVPLVLQVAVSW